VKKERQGAGEKDVAKRFGSYEQYYSGIYP
jgi:hypothetical protein